MLNGDVTENADVDLKLFSKKTKHCHKENGRACGSEEEHEVCCLVCTDPDSMALMSKAQTLGSFC